MRHFSYRRTVSNYWNMVSKLILTVFFSATASFIYGQEFYDRLYTEADSTYDCSFEYCNADSVNHIFFNSRNVRMLIDSTASYQVMFTESKSGCNGPYCNDNYRFLSFDSLVFIDEIIGVEEDLVQLNLRRKKYYHCSKTYKGVELIKNTDINFKDTVFNNFPIVNENWDKYNKEWTVFSNEKYLVFRFFSLYIGNTSYYEEKIIYLKRIE